MNYIQKFYLKHILTLFDFYPLLFFYTKYLIYGNFENRSVKMWSTIKMMIDAWLNESNHLFTEYWVREDKQQNGFRSTPLPFYFIINALVKMGVWIYHNLFYALRKFVNKRGDRIWFINPLCISCHAISQKIKLNNSIIHPINKFGNTFHTLNQLYAKSIWKSHTCNYETNWI